jgi:glutamate dehydrogenase
MERHPMTTTRETRRSVATAPVPRGQAAHQQRLEQAREERIRRAQELAPEIAKLVPLFFRHVPAEELVETDPAELAATVRSHMELAGDRPPGRPKIRSLNPSRRETGWSCPYTVVQIVTDDMPYLVDSVVAELTKAGSPAFRVIHPIVVVRRTVTGALTDVLVDCDPDEPPDGANAESWMYLEVGRVVDPEAAAKLERRLKYVLTDVREVVEDSSRMVQMAESIVDELRESPPPGLPGNEVTGGARFLRWLAGGHFTFLGYRRYELIETADGGEPALRAALASGLGVLRKDSLAARSFSVGQDGRGLGIAEQALRRELLVLTQASVPSTVVRAAYPYYVGVKIFDERGEVRGEHRFLGMLTSTAMHEDVLDIPVINDRVYDVIHRAGVPLESHSGQRMLDVIQNYPRAELFSTDTDTLYQTVTGVLSLAERRTLRLFLRRDPYYRFYSCLVYLPRDRYTTTSRMAMEDVLLRELSGHQVEFSTRVGESELARAHFTVHTDPVATADAQPDVVAIQELLSEAVRTWNDRLREAVQKLGDAQPERLERLTALVDGFRAGLPEGYKEAFTPEEALEDLQRLDRLPLPDGLDMSFYAPAGAEPGEVRFKLYLAREGVTLSHVLPMLQSMGVEVLDERPYQLTRENTKYWIYDFGLWVAPAVFDGRSEEELTQTGRRFQDAFAATWYGLTSVDRFNSLVLHARLDWRQAAVLRAYAKYLRQARFQYTQALIEDVLRDHTEITAALVRLFVAKFDSAGDGTETVAELSTRITTMIDEVMGLDADRILRGYLTLISATLRSNYFVTGEDGKPRPFLAFKLDSRAIPDLPQPRPRFEIFVYSPRVEGVHLRFGPVARGGLRWSDRREDFRTEILGLVKAQAVKNAVIVPVGAKGGFVVKRPPAPIGDPVRDREAQLAEGVECYRMFISGLLDLTDNLVGGQTVPASQVVRYDGDDPYLVVAADKGTAKFSDLANEVAISRGFWLGDAFASGGSAGYDHKAMGITARGAWESVQRHFRELGCNTQTDDFTVVGVGDMSGDVFGNGMLLSRHIRLVAAFDHRHVFIDPDPHAARSFDERRRLSQLPRSSWDDYDRALISEGGGVWSRSVKSIPISPQAREALGLPPDTPAKLTPPELLRAVLLAPVDLLFNGGIGTYVKGSTETNGEVGDKANDMIRVDGGELRVKVVGEGGNLGFTQRGRIEFARQGGKINTDAIDNSGGVDCSDHEVNIKILLDRLIDNGALAAPERNPLLARMTDEVAELVLADDYSQNEVLGVGRAHAVPMLSVHSRLVDYLCKHGGLDRKLEVLPTPAQFEALEQIGDGLTSPELCILLAYVKLGLKDEVLASELPDLDVFSAKLPDYFPTPLRDGYREAIFQHPLRREITTTMVVNEVVDRGGVSFAFRLIEELAASATDAVRAFEVVAKVFDLPGMWLQIRALDNAAPTAVQYGVLLECRRLLDRAARWMLTNRPQPLQVGAEIARFAPVVSQLSPELPKLLRGRDAAAMNRLCELFVRDAAPVELAGRASALLLEFGLLDVAEVTEQVSGVSALEAAELYYALSAHLDLDLMLSSVTALERGSRWHALARLALRDDLYSSLRDITLEVLRSTAAGAPADEKIAQWEHANASRLARARAALAEIAESGQLDLATLSVAARQIRSMAR